MDMTKSFHFYRLAAEQGRALSQVYLGQHYAGGDCTERDLNAAFSWYRKAAAQGQPEVTLSTTA
jgi:TPR repeat protein